MRRRLWCVLLVVVLDAGTGYGGHEGEGTAAAGPTSEDVQKAMDVMQPTTIYGRVVDEDGNAVEDASVEVSWQTLLVRPGWATVVNSKWIKADRDGGFVWHLVKGFQPVIRRVEKDGYECLTDRCPYFDPMIGGSALLNSTTKQKPVEFYLRKKGPTTFLVTRGNLRVNFGLGGEVFWWPDLLQGMAREELHPAHSADVHDVSGLAVGIRVWFSTNNMAYHIAFVAPEGGSVLLSDRILFEAPESGYRSSVSTTISAKGQQEHPWTIGKPLWLFVKSSAPAVYARLCMEFDAVRHCFRVKTAVNPYGERNLEEETELGYLTTRRLDSEARTALRRKTYPPKPNVRRLVEEHRENAEAAGSKKPSGGLPAD